MKKLYINRIKPILFYTKQYFKAIRNIYKKENEYHGYKSLGPTENAKEIKAYTDGLKQALNNERNTNIAVTGKYGAGKSSILLTFFSNFENSIYNPIYVSLASFNNVKVDPENQEKINEYNQSIEKSILQQLLYHVDEKKVPLSSFKRISKVSKCKILLYAFFLCAAISSCILLFMPTFYSIFDKQIEKIYTQNSSNWILSNVTRVLIISFILWIVYYVLYLIIAKYSIGKIKIKDAEIEINGKNESLFNRFIDEILYFFQVSEHQVVVIEDLDRFERPEIIFSKLRELNILINNSNQIKRRIAFIYAMKDDFFDSAEKRTKFFDYILPVIPVVSNSSSNEVLWKRLKEMNSANICNEINIRKSVINDISPYIADNRTIDSILNEFCIYKNKFSKKGLDDEKLFAMLVYKNLCPKEYNQLLCDVGNIANLFKKKHTITSNAHKEKTDILSELKSKRKKRIEDPMHEIEELKLALLYSVQMKSSYLLAGFVTNSRQYTIKEFLEEDFDNALIIDFIRAVNRANQQIEIDDCFMKFGGNHNFIERLDNLSGRKDQAINRIDEDIQKLNEDIILLNEQSMEELVSNNLEDSLIANLSNLENFLVRRGYLNEQYKEFMTVFIEGDLSENDYRYIVNVKNREAMPYDFELKNIPQIVNERLDKKDLREPFFLNFQVVDYIISESNLDKDRTSLLFQILNTPSDKNLDFIIKFVKFTQHIENFINELFLRSEDLIEYLFITSEGSNEIINQWIQYYILYSNKDFDFSSKIHIINFINESTNLDYIFNNTESDVIINELRKLEIRFKDLRFTNDMQKALVYKNNLVELNFTMVSKLLEFYGIDASEYLNSSLTIIFDSKNKNISKLILERFSEFADKSYRITSNDAESQETIRFILMHPQIDAESKLVVLENLNIQINDIKEISNNLLVAAIELDKIKGSWENLFYLIKLLDKIYPVNDSDDDKCISDQYIATFYNNNSDVLGRESHVVDRTEGERLLINLDITNDSIIQTSNCFKYAIKSLNLIDCNHLVAKERLDTLIEENLLSINKDNYLYLLENDLFNSAAFLLAHDFATFCENIDDFEVPVDVQCEFIALNCINLDSKLQFINLLDFDELHDSLLDFYVNNISFEKIYAFNDNLINYLLSQLKSIDDEIVYLIVILKNGMDITSFLKYCSKPLSWIGDINMHSISIDKNQVNQNFVDLLVEANYVKSYVVRVKKIVIYNKRKK